MRGATTGASNPAASLPRGSLPPPSRLKQAWHRVAGFLPLPREHVRLEIYPQRVVAGRWARDGSPCARRMLDCAESRAGERGWEPALAALDTLLALPDFAAAPASVVLSGHYVRSLIIPWRDDIAGARERGAYVRHCFVRAYGEAIADRELCLAAAPYGAPAVATAVDSKLLHALQAAAHRAALRLEVVEPFLAAAFNRARGGIDETDFWFVAAEPGHACVARIEAGVWKNLRCQRIGIDWRRELPSLLERERLLGGVEALGPVYLYAPGLAGGGLLCGEWTHAGLKMPPETGIADPAALRVSGGGA